MAQYKKKIKPGLIELDPSEPTLIVHLTIQLLDTTQTDDDGRPQCVSLTNEQRRFKLKTFKSNSNIPKFAAALIAKCELIHESKTRHVESLLAQLAERLASAGGERVIDLDEEDAEESVRQPFNLNTTAPMTVARNGQVRVSASTSSPQSLRDSKAALSVTGPQNLGALKTRHSTGAMKSHHENEEKESDTPLSAPVMEKNKKKRVPDTEVPVMEAVRPQSRRSTRAEALPASPQSSMHEEKEKERESKSERARRSAAPANTTMLVNERSPLLLPQRERSRPFDLIEELLQSNPSASDASIDDIDNYIDMLYDDIPSKINASAAILALITQPQLLGYFASSSHSNVMEILSRILGEERKKSQELLLILLSIFYCISHFSSLHSILVSNKITELVLKIVAFEIKRFDVRANEKKIKNSNSTNNFLALQNKILFLSFSLLLNVSEDLQLEMKMKQKDFIPLLVRTLSRSLTITDKAARIPFANNRYFLELNVALLACLKKLSIFEENKNEMLTLQLNQRLFAMIENRRLMEDYCLCEALVKFLYNLSFDRGQRQELMRNEKPLMQLFHTLNVVHASTSNHNLFNQSLFVNGVKLFYSLSMDFDVRARLLTMIQRVDQRFLLRLLQILIESKSKFIDENLSAFVINCIDLDDASSDSGSDSGTLVPLSDMDAAEWNLLIKRVCHTPDVMSAKLLHHCLLVNDDIKVACIKHVHELVSAAVRSNGDLMVQLLSILCDMHGIIPINDSYDEEDEDEENEHPNASDDTPLAVITECAANIPWNDLIVANHFLAFLIKCISSREDDIKLLCLRLLSHCVVNENIARKSSEISAAMGSAGLVNQLSILLVTHSHDSDMIAQTIYLVFTLCLYSGSRQAIIKHSKLIPALINFTVDQCKAVRALSHQCLDCIVSYSDEWAEKIKAVRFERYNAQWLQMIGFNTTLGHGLHSHDLPSDIDEDGGDESDEDEYVDRRSAAKLKARESGRVASGRSRARVSSGNRSRSPSI